MLIARTKPKLRYDVDKGEFYHEYRVRPLTEDEKRSIHNWHGEEWALISQRIDTGDDPKIWEAVVWDIGFSPLDAAMRTLGDTSYMEAESLDPIHAEVIKVNEAIGKLRDLEHELFKSTHKKSEYPPFDYVERDPEKELKEETTKEYNQQLKSAKLWKKAQEGTAPQEKIDEIHKRVLTAHNQKLKKVVAEHKEMMKQLIDVKKKIQKLADQRYM